MALGIAPKADSRGRDWFLAGTDSLLAAIHGLEQTAVTGATTDLPRAFATARDRYKVIESIAALSFPGTVEAMNGAPILHVEDGSPSTVIQPEGFQLLEQLIGERPIDTARVRLETRILFADATRMRAMATTITIAAPLAFESARHELTRIATRGLMNADSPTALRGAAESSMALRGVLDLITLFARGAPDNARRHLDRFGSAISSARTRLAAGEDVDRAGLLSRELRAAAHQLDSLRRALHVASPQGGSSIWRASSAFVFDSSAFNADALAPRDNRGASPARVALGRLLFFDPALSGNGQRSCASCHNPDHAFSDGRAASPVFGQRGTLRRNAPSLINAALQPALFHDMRTAYLEDQAAQVIENPAEMHGNLDTIVGRLRTSDEYRSLFGGQRIQRDDIRMALAAYLRSLVALDAPIDRFMRGDATALTAGERRGFNLFVGKARCATCHFLPLTGGVVPPAFSEVEAEGLGVPSRHGAARDDDPGLAARTRFHADSFHFRTPSLRNVALSAPYMHNGAFRTLEEVIDFYNAGGGGGRGFATTHQTLPGDSLHLSPAHRRDLLAFLSALTDTAGLTARPARLPHLPAPGVSRQVGGVY